MIHFFAAAVDPIGRIVLPKRSWSVTSVSLTQLLHEDHLSSEHELRVLVSLALQLDPHV